MATLHDDKSPTHNSNNDGNDMKEQNHNPFVQLVQDWRAAKEARDPNAPFGTLMTIDDQGRPTGRILGLRDIHVSSGSLLVYTNSTSPKYQQIASSNGSTAYEILLFWTTPHMLQYRLSGLAWSAVSEADMQKQWAQHKPHRSKLLDYYYQHHQAQSSVLAGGRAQFVQEMNDLRAKFPKDDNDNASPVPFQSVNVGLWLQPDKVEEWRCSPQDRWHERYRFQKATIGHDDSSSWTKETLVP